MLSKTRRWAEKSDAKAERSSVMPRLPPSARDDILPPGLNIESDPTLPPRLAQAGGEIYQSVCTAIADNRGTHLETAIAAAGYLAGTAMLLNTGVNLSALKPGTPVFVDQVNEAGI